MLKLLVISLFPVLSATEGHFTARVKMIANQQNIAVGTLMLRQGTSGVRVSGNLTLSRDMWPQMKTASSVSKHGFHVHAKPLDSPGDCMSTGGHYNPENVAHGARSDTVRHVGDLGNIECFTAAADIGIKRRHDVGMQRHHDVGVQRHHDVGVERHHRFSKRKLGDSDMVMTCFVEFTDDVIQLGTGTDQDVLGLAIVLHADADKFKKFLPENKEKARDYTGDAGARIACGTIEED